MAENDSKKVANIETPSLLSEEDKEFILKKANEWKNAKGGSKYDITALVKTAYKIKSKDSDEEKARKKYAVEYFSRCKNNGKVVQKKNKDHTEISEEKRKLNNEISDALKEVFHCKIFDENLFSFDENYSVKSYFWKHFHIRVVPNISIEYSDLKYVYIYAYLSLKINRVRFRQGLRDIKFKDENHMWNYILKFISDNIMTTYQVVNMKRKQKELDEQKNREELERKIQYEEMMKQASYEEYLNSDEDNKEEKVKKHRKRNYDEYI